MSYESVDTIVVMLFAMRGKKGREVERYRKIKGRSAGWERARVQMEMGSDNVRRRRHEITCASGDVR